MTTEDKDMERDFEGADRAEEEPGGEAEAEAEGEGAIQELPEEEILRLTEELSKKAREAEESNSRYLRARADLENYRRRAEQEKSEFATYANESLITEILPVVDNLERAVEHAGEGGGDVEGLRKGVELTINQLFGVLKKFGLEEVKARGEKFDPELHHAISHDEDPDAPEGTVLEVFQKGYLLKDRLIRPAMVSVAKDSGDKG